MNSQSLDACIGAVLKNYPDIEGEMIKEDPFLFYDALEEDPPSFKYVGRIRTSGEESFILKLLKDERTTSSFLYEQYLLSEVYLKHGLFTSKRKLSLEGKDHCFVEYKGHRLYGLLESDLGEEIKEVDAHLCEEAGKLLAKMHLAVEKEDYHMENGYYIFTLGAHNELCGIEKLLFLLSEQGYQKEAKEIEAIYQEKLTALLKASENFPRGGVQGDLSNNNLCLCSTGELGFFDYNCAGEAVFLHDAILQGLFFAKVMDYSDPKESWEKRFSLFFDAYRSLRSLSYAEEEMWRDLYILSETLWFHHFSYAEDSLEEKLKKNPVMDLSDYIQKIKEILLSLGE